jgi:hypothetical protein
VGPSDLVIHARLEFASYVVKTITDKQAEPQGQANTDLVEQQDAIITNLEAVTPDLKTDLLLSLKFQQMPKLSNTLKIVNTWKPRKQKASAYQIGQLANGIKAMEKAKD